MAVARNDSGTPNVAGLAVTTLDLTTFTVLAGNQLLLVAVVVTDGLASPGQVALTWDPSGTNQAMTQINLYQTGASVIRGFMFVRTSPTPGNLVLHAAGLGGFNAVIGAVAFSGVDQAVGYIAGDTARASGGTLIASQTITSDAQGATVCLIGRHGVPIASTTSQTQIFLDNTNFGVSASFALGGVTNTHSWSSTGTVATWITLGIHIQAYIPPGGNGGISSSAGNLEVLGNGIESGLQQPWLVFDATMGGN